MIDPKEIRDVIHGFVFRSEVEESIIDTKVFQRLRGVKQLAMANLVYPGALHTRFDHSIGVMHIAGRMADQFKLSDEERRIIRFTALLHDIGHGPFSHVSEDLLKKYYEKVSFNSAEKEEVHETITCNIISKNKEISTCLSDKDKESIISLISKDSNESIKKNIITGPIDADKLDYLLRDSYYCGVKYGVYDIERLLSTLTDFDQAQDRIIAVKEGGIYAVEQFVISKYHMSSQVYRHKIRLVTDAMIIRGLELGIEKDELGFLTDLYKYDGSTEFVENYLNWDDSRVINEIIFNTNNFGYCKKIFLRLRERKLFKSLFHGQLSEFKNPIVKDSLSELENNPPLRLFLELKIAEYLSKIFQLEIDPNYVLFIVLNIKSVRAEKPKDNIGNILIKLDNGDIKTFNDCSTLFKSINAKEINQFIEIFAPIEFKSDLIKRKTRVQINKDLFTIISDETENYLKQNKKEVINESK